MGESVYVAMRNFIWLHLNILKPESISCLAGPPMINGNSALSETNTKKKKDVWSVVIGRDPDGAVTYTSGRVTHLPFVQTKGIYFQK